MELLQLKYFKKVAEMGKISDAANALFISAPALSTSIARLEKELGTKLFDRTNNKILLNRQGQILLHHANQVFSTLEKAKTELQQSAMIQGRHVSVACVGSSQWVDMITAFSQENPRFTLLCTSVTRADLAANGFSAQHSFFLASEDDIPENYADKLDSVFLFEDHPVVVVHKDHPIAQQKMVDLHMLREENLFLPMQNYSLRDHLERMFMDYGIPFSAGNAYSHLATHQMVAAGLGIAFLTSHTALARSQALHVVPIANEYKPWACRLYWRRHQTLTDDEKLFKEFVLQYYQK